MKHMLLFAAMMGSFLGAFARRLPPRPPRTGPTRPELSIVLTEGNASTQTVGFKDTLARRWTGSRAQLKLEALRTADSDDWFTQVDPGLTWEPGGTPTGGTSTTGEAVFRARRGELLHRGEVRLLHPPGADLERRRLLGPEQDAGIESRYIVFAGPGTPLVGSAETTSSSPPTASPGPTAARRRRTRRRTSSSRACASPGIPEEVLDEQHVHQRDDHQHEPGRHRRLVRRT
jgi:hypothetical protein